jgi:preprotein translocase subunit YajC
MTMLPITGGPVVLAMATPTGEQPSLWVQLIPFVAVLAIFYFVILLPMKRRQKKVQAFLDSLKVGDRVVTTGGMFGVITRLNDRTVQLQIADKVKVEFSRAAIAGLQGQDPVVPDNSSSQ